jgi:hypothetical protein
VLLSVPDCLTVLPQAPVVVPLPVWVKTPPPLAALLRPVLLPDQTVVPVAVLVSVLEVRDHEPNSGQLDGGRIGCPYVADLHDH